MKKRTILSLLLAVMLVASFSVCALAAEVELRMGSWRTDDVAQMNNVLAEYKKIVPNVNIVFQAINPPDYNATLRTQLESGAGPDLIYARSYATGRELFEAGFFADCTDIPGLMDNFTAANLAPWQAPDGRMFAIPFAAVSHAVYYNKDVFKKEGLEIPNTWDEFIALCAALKDKGYTPLANGVAEEWDILECFFLGMLPSFVGGADERVLYESGEWKLNNLAFVTAFSALAQAAPYLPDGFEAMTSYDSQVMFGAEMAVMLPDGSWNIKVYDDAPFEWGLFALPGPKAGDTVITFHPDMAISMNAATAHPEEARAFLEWLCTEEGVAIASSAFPTGFFPMIDFPITLEDVHANEFLALNAGRETDARFVWPALIDLYTPMNHAVINVLKGTMTPQEAADSVEAARP